MSDKRNPLALPPPPLQKRVFYKSLGSHNPRGLARRGMRGALFAPIRQRILQCLIYFSGLFSDAVRVLDCIQSKGRRNSKWWTGKKLERSGTILNEVSLDICPTGLQKQGKRRNTVDASGETRTSHLPDSSLQHYSYNLLGVFTASICTSPGQDDVCHTCGTTCKCFMTYFIEPIIHTTACIWANWMGKVRVICNFSIYDF